ncbi:unnamed protein product [Lactuca saligna]|uniref:Anaphase-promoting complex subunit 1 n=1 Tax=Lactuca saligna TaxID=75948 RepID=A0AA36EBV9_LACSI|nr:unnamed protein product [Lactuca saligna]
MQLRSSTCFSVFLIYSLCRHLHLPSPSRRRICPPNLTASLLDFFPKKGAEHIAPGGGRVCIVRSGGVGILAVDVVSSLPRLWVLDSPAGQQVLALHILPRMCPKEFQSPVVV